MPIIPFATKIKSPAIKGRALDRAIKAELDRLSTDSETADFARQAVEQFVQEVFAITPMSAIGTEAWTRASTECLRRLLAKLQAGPRPDAA